VPINWTLRDPEIEVENFVDHVASKMAVAVCENAYRY
jgi:hypothetical protein